MLWTLRSMRRCWRWNSATWTGIRCRALIWRCWMRYSRWTTKRVNYCLKWGACKRLTLQLSRAVKRRLELRVGALVEKQGERGEQRNDLGADRPPVQRVRRASIALRERWRADWRRQPRMEVRRLRQDCGSDGAGGAVLVRPQPQTQPQRDGIRVPAVHGAGDKARASGRVQGLRLRPKARRRGWNHAGTRLSGRYA